MGEERANSGAEKGKKRSVDMVFTLAIAAAGGFIGIKLKLPAGGLVGSMVAVALAQIGGLRLGSMPPGAMIVLQVLVGMMIGLGITREAALEMKQLALPGLLLVLGMVVAGVTMGFLVKKISGLDLVTSLYSTAPGGMMDMVLISSTQGADAPKVAVLHLMRLAGVIIILPPLLRWLVK